MLRHSQTLLATARLTWRGLLLVGVALLTSCGGLYPEAHIPVSGITGNNGGATETIYYDSAGSAHFRS